MADWPRLFADGTVEELAEQCSNVTELARRLSELLDEGVTTTALNSAAQRERKKDPRLPPLRDMFEDRTNPAYQTPAPVAEHKPLKDPARKRRQTQRPSVLLPECRRFVVLGDTHFPIQDQAAIDAAVAFLRDYKPDRVFVSDAVDMYSLTSHAQEVDRILGRKYTVHEEAESAQPFWAALQECCAEVHLIPGNHEFRLKRFVNNNIGLHEHPAWSLSSVLNLPAGVECHPWNARVIMGDCVVEHGDRLKGVGARHCAANVLHNHPRRWSFFGHTHRLDSKMVTHYPRGEAETFGAYSAGHLSRLECHMYAPDPNWQLGLVAVDVFEGVVQPTPVRIDGGRLLWNGHVYGGWS